MMSQSSVVFNVFVQKNKSMYKIVCCHCRLNQRIKYMISCFRNQSSFIFIFTKIPYQHQTKQQKKTPTYFLVFYYFTRKTRSSYYKKVPTTLCAIHDDNHSSRRLLLLLEQLCWNCGNHATDLYLTFFPPQNQTVNINARQNQFIVASPSLLVRQCTSPLHQHQSQSVCDKSICFEHTGMQV